MRDVFLAAIVSAAMIVGSLYALSLIHLI